jgi:hypothetical protein
MKFVTLRKVRRRVFLKLGRDIVPFRGDTLIMALNIINCMIYFYNGITETTISYLDCVAGNIFRHMTVEEAKVLLNTIT